MTTKSWGIRNLLGWCKIRLDDICKTSLETDQAYIGLRTDKMLIETDGTLVSKNNSSVTAECVIRLIGKRVNKHKRQKFFSIFIKCNLILN